MTFDDYYGGQSARAEVLTLLESLPPEALAEAISSLPGHMAEAITHDWHFWARPDQLLPGNVNPRTPDGAWSYWLALAGRGWGKTRTGAETVRQWVRQGHNLVNLVGATVDDARDIMIDGESGILATCPKAERPRFIGNKRQLRWPNGAVSLVFTADEPERLRGKQHQKLWADELAAWRYPEAWDQAKFGLRLGRNPQAFISTTPRPFQIVKDLIADPDTLITRGTTYDNKANLARTFFTSIIRKYEGTRLGRQELLGVLLDDNPNALFKRSDIERNRKPLTDALALLLTMDRIVVGVDPAASSDEDSDECGIVVCGVRHEADSRFPDGACNHGYVFDDVSDIFSPREWAQAAVDAYTKWHGDRIVAEVNNGGEMVSYTIRTVDEDVPVSTVHASRGKAIRAEPISALYEQGRIHHVGTFGVLEDQMTGFDPADDSGKSPDRMDALVWALTELMVGAGEDGLLNYLRGEKRKSDAAKDAAQRDETRIAGNYAAMLMLQQTNGSDDDDSEEDDD